ncbi:retrotransposon protein, putative, ty1-copia subclass, partial [Tanacetum coccineum]
ARINADKILAEELQKEEREKFTSKQRAKILHDTIVAQRKFLAQQRKKHSDLKTKTFEEIQVLYERLKRQDQNFVAIGSELCYITSRNQTAIYNLLSYSLIMPTSSNVLRTLEIAISQVGLGLYHNGTGNYHDLIISEIENVCHYLFDMYTLNFILFTRDQNDVMSLCQGGSSFQGNTWLYEYYLEQPADTATEAEKAAFRAEYKKHSDVACIMLGKMSHALQRQFENYPPQNIGLKFEKCCEKPCCRTNIFTIWWYAYLVANRPLNGKSYKDQACHHCHVAGHWKRNCPLYLEELRANKKKSAEHSQSACSFRDVKQKGKLFMGFHNLTSGQWNTSSCVFSLSCLLDLGFHHTIASNGISVSLNGIFYFSAISVNGVFEIDMNNNVPKNNNNSIFSINKKRKLDLDFLIYGTVDLAHIGNDSMQKLHSRYGYVYLLKHKHEVFETFKVFKAEVELQLGKKIKALRSDRGGEYLSQEFKDYLREIVHYWDIVRSKIHYYTFTVIHLGYAFESAVRILNIGTHYEDTLRKTMGYYFYFPPENKVIVARSERISCTQPSVLNMEDEDDEVYKADVAFAQNLSVDSTESRKEKPPLGCCFKISKVSEEYGKICF